MPRMWSKQCLLDLPHTFVHIVESIHANISPTPNFRLTMKLKPC